MNAWRAQAACADIHPDVFFPTKGASPLPAQRICSTCPVIDACREYALGHNLLGVWGGLTTQERKDIRRAAA